MVECHQHNEQRIWLLSNKSNFTPSVSVTNVVSIGGIGLCSTLKGFGEHFPNQSTSESTMKIILYYDTNNLLRIKFIFRK